MPSGFDMSKQIGPLPLGAWVIVVGAGVGIALWTRRSPVPAVVESGNGTPGVGTGGSGQFTDLTPTPANPAQQAPTTNEQWGVKAINWLIANGYPANVADSAIRKYLSGAKLSVQEFTMVGIVLVALGSPPQILPPGDEEPPTTQPPATDPPPPATQLSAPSNVNGFSIWTYAIELHWGSVSGAEGYRIMVNGEADTNNWRVGTGKMIMGLQPGTSYSITVAGVKGNTVGPASSPITIRTRG